MDSKQVRTGHWHPEELEYMDILAEEFRDGSLSIKEGSTLRAYLAEMLNCIPKRVSKRMEGSNYNGRKTFVKRIFSETEQQERDARISASRERFEEALRIYEDLKKKSFDDHLQANVSSRCGPTVASNTTINNGGNVAPGTNVFRAEDSVLSFPLSGNMTAPLGRNQVNFLVPGLGGGNNASVHARLVAASVATPTAPSISRAAVLDQLAPLLLAASNFGSMNIRNDLLALNALAALSGSSTANLFPTTPAVDQANLRRRALNTLAALGSTTTTPTAEPAPKRPRINYY
ncbi:expressed unknown protein [Seminavis robusta]|uniref:Uncharacterized protein n=1 Tax=Seminavis robusta TaxID=568900 RepID=A0A9N8HPX1_9STRA|nr:expressed unknown protein [Seminavis robusta]|eukprot:Sro1371_g267120.1 n/a (289) ;mRNA; r:24643-25509